MHQMESVRSETIGDAVADNEGALVPIDAVAQRAVREEKRTYAVTEQVVVDDQVQSIRKEDAQHLVEDAITGQMLGTREETIRTEAVTDMLTGIHEERRQVDYVEDTARAVPAPAGTQAICDGEYGQALAVAGGGQQVVRTYGATTEAISMDMVLGEEMRTQAHSFQAIDARTGKVLQEGDGVKEILHDEFGTETVANYATLDAVTGLVDQGQEAKSIAYGMGGGGSDATAVTQERQTTDAITGAVIEQSLVDKINDGAGETTNAQFAIADGKGLIYSGGMSTDVTVCPHTGVAQTVQSQSKAVMDAMTGAVIESSATSTQAIADQTGESAVHTYSNVDASGILREGEATHTTMYSAKGESQTTTVASHVGYDLRTGQLVESA
jgi:hypothetical protein